jgi:ATP:ADP antiporter, AAA family
VRTEHDASMSAATPHSFSDRRWYVEPGERVALAAAAGTYFLLLCGYYMLRSLREAMALEAGRAQIPLLFTLTFIVMLAILPAYWWIVARVRRDRLLAVIYLPFVLLFAVVATVASSGRVPPLLAGGYFIFVSALNLFLVSVFWSVMVDLWKPNAAKRLFGFVSAGGSAGALVGPAFNASFVERLGVSAVIYIACSLFVIAVFTGIAAQRLRARAPETDVDTRVAVGGRAIDDLRRLAGSPYLLAIAGFIVLVQWFGAFMYNEQARYVDAAYANLTERAAVFARLDLASSAFSLLVQAIVVGWLTVRGGVRATLTTMWAVAAVSFGALALVPTGAMLLITQVVRRSADYGLFKPAREMLFTVLSPETRFKSKSLLDTVLHRGADSVGNGLYVLVAPLGLAGIAASCASACVLLVMGARWLGAAFADRESKGLRSR